MLPSDSGIMCSLDFELSASLEQKRHFMVSSAKMNRTPGSFPRHSGTPYLCLPLAAQLRHDRTLLARSAVDRFHGDDMNQVALNHAIRCVPICVFRSVYRQNDVHAVPGERGQFGMSNLVRLSVGQVNSKGSKRFLSQDVPYFVLSQYFTLSSRVLRTRRCRQHGLWARCTSLCCRAILVNANLSVVVSCERHEHPESTRARLKRARAGCLSRCRVR